MAKKVKKTVKKKVIKKKAVKKIVAKKSSPKIGENSKPLTAKEVAHFRDLLVQKRRELIGDVNSIEDEALRKSRLEAAGDLSSMPIHMADIGTDNYEQEFSLNLLEGERKMLGKINNALDRIANKVYGVCEGTGNWISRPRLEARPWARHCIEYARMIEKGLVPKDADDDGQ